MAKFFKYKTIADLTAENARLGIDLRYSDDLSPLFQPIQLGTMRAGNRMCIHPMEGCDGKLDGTPDELTFRRYRRFGGGGAKVIWGEAAAVCEEGRANPRQIWINDSTFPAFVRLVEECRAEHRKNFGTDDVLLGLQLTHSGRYSTPRPLIACHDPLLDQRTVADRTTGRMVDADYPPVTDDYLKGLVDYYVAAAKLAVRAGFDFLDIKQCHRYLINELLGARNRPGIYGGSYENRTRLPREIFAAIRTALPRTPLATRLNAYDCIPFGKGPDNDGTPNAWTAPLANGWGMSVNDPFVPNLAEVKRWLRDMQGMGLVFANITIGNPYAQPHIGRPFEYPPPDGYESPEHPLIGVDRHFRIAAELQQSQPDLPMVGTGYSYLQEFLFNAGAANLRDGNISLVGVGRASLSQPDFAKQLMDHGKLDRKRVCRTFSTCTAMMRSKSNELGQYAAGCPPFDKEGYGELWNEIQQLGLKT